MFRATLGIAFLLAITANVESAQRTATVGESGTNTDLYVLHGDRVILTYTHRDSSQSVTLGWFINVNAVGNPISITTIPNAGQFNPSGAGLTRRLAFEANDSIPEGTLFTVLVTVTTVSNGVPTSSSSFAGSVIIKLGVIPKLQLDRISDVIAERDPINISVDVIEGRPNPNVTLLNTTHDQSLMLVALNSTRYQIRKTSASISDRGVYRIEAMNAVGSNSINFTVTVHFLRLVDCNLCSASKGSVVNCIFSSSPKPIEVKFSNLSRIPMKRANESDNYEISIMIPGQSVYTLMIRNEYNLSVVQECNRSATTAPTVSTTVAATTAFNANATNTPTVTSNVATEKNASSVLPIAVGSAVGGVALIVLLILFLCTINLSCRRWLQRVCCSCCFRCYDNCCGTQCDGEAPDESKATCCRGCYNCWACCFNCCNGSHNGRKKESVPMEDVEEAEPYATSPGAPAAASSKKKEDEVEPYGMSGGAVSDTKEKKSKPAPKSAPKEEYAQPDISKKSKKRAAQQAPTGGDVYAQVDKKKKDEKGDVNYAALDHSGSKSATLQSASNEGGVVYSHVQKN